MNIYVGNLSYRMNDKDLEGIFIKFGAVKKCKKLSWIEKQENQKVLVLLKWEDSSAGTKAIEALNGNDCEGRTLRVNENKTKRRKTKKIILI